MARTRAEIEQEIEDQKAADATLLAVSSVSSTSVWGAIKKVIAYCVWVFETLMDKYQAEINQNASAAVYGHDEWWAKKMLEFQYGDSLAIQDTDGKKRMFYPVVDPSKQIIKRASIKDDGKGGSVIKIAKESGSTLVALTTSEFNAAKSYVNKQQPAGTKITLQSKNTDVAKYFITIYYDPLVPLEDIGSVLGIETNVETAMNNYHKNIDFDGGVDLRKLEDALQAISGIDSFVTTNAEAKPAGGVYSSFNRRYETIAGFIMIDPAFPAKSTDNGGTITYIPNV